MAASEEQNGLNTEHTQDGELEQYGVWVKAGPEDVDESAAEDEAFTLTDLGDDELDDAELDILGIDSLEETDEEPVVEDDLGEEIELDALDIDEESLISTDDAPEPEPVALDDEPDIDELLTIEEDEITLDFDSQSPDEEEPPAIAEPELGGSDATEEDLDGGIDIDDELPGSLDDLTLDLDSLDVDSFSEPSSSTPPAQTTETETEPESELELEEADELEELDTDLDANILNLDEEDLNLEEDELDLESLSLGDDDTEVAELDLSALPDDEDEFGSLNPADLEQSAEDELPELEADDDQLFDGTLDESFDDVGAVEEQMLSEPTPPAADDQSRSLLESIERELGSIRTELSDLKRELSQLREEPGRTIETMPEGDDEEAAGGFFEDDDEDEDETIALTGAELDNIMNTAEFTEETGRPTDLDELLKEQPVETTTESDAVQEITLEEAPEDLGAIDLDLGGDSEEPVEPVFSGSDEDVEALASMDIDAELADIEDLDDEAPAPADSFDELTPEAETETETQTETDLDLIFDAEPLDLEEEPTIDAPGPSTPRAEDEPATPPASHTTAEEDATAPIPENLKGELRSVLNYMDKLLDSLPEEKIQEFAASEHFKVYKRLFEELGLEQ